MTQFLPGAVECPVRPCGPSPDYNFYIDRLDTLVNTTYAHYSFQLQFDNNGEYSVFIDGCCRPSIFKNKFGLPFHMRAGIQLYAEGQGQGVARPYPKQSVQTRMPNVVMLREGGVAYDTCKEAPCDLVGDETICYLRFQVHAYHPLAEYRDKLGNFCLFALVLLAHFTAFSCPVQEVCSGYCCDTEC